jgi:hypothetical protein
MSHSIRMECQSPTLRVDAASIVAPGRGEGSSD